MSDDLEKKVRGVLSRVIRDLPVFGGPLKREIEARLPDEATPEIVALLEGDGSSWSFDGETPTETVARLMREKNDAENRLSAVLSLTAPEITSAYVGGRGTALDVNSCASRVVDLIQSRARIEQPQSKPAKPGPWYLATRSTRPGRFAVRSNDDGTTAVASLREASPVVGSIEYSVPLSYARSEFALGDPVFVDDTFDIVWTLNDCENARDALLAKGDPESRRLAECHAKRAEHLRDVASRPRPW